MKHVKNSLKDSVKFLEHNGIPTQTITDYNETILDGSLCIDATNFDLYILRNGTWETFLFGSGNFIPLGGTEFNKPVTGDIEIAINKTLSSDTNSININDSNHDVHIIYNETTNFIFGKNVIIGSEIFSIPITDGLSVKNYINGLRSIAPFLVNTFNNIINVSTPIPNASTSFTNVNNSNITGILLNTYFSDITETSIYINNAVYNAPITLEGIEYSNVRINGSIINPLLNISNSDINLVNLSVNNDINNINNSTINGNYKIVDITGVLNSVIGSLYRTYLRNANNHYIYGYVTASSNGDFDNSGTGGRFSIIQDNTDFFNFGFLGDVYIVNTQQTLLLGFNNSLDITDSFNTIMVNSNKINIADNANYNTIINQDGVHQDTLINSSILESSYNLFINNKYTSVSGIGYNILFGTYNTVINGERNIITSNFNGSLASNNVIFSLDTDIDATLGSTNFIFGTITSSSLNGVENLNNNNILLGTIVLNNTITSNNVVISAKPSQNISHGIQDNNIFLNVTDFTVPFSNTVYLPESINFINNGFYGKLSVENISTDRTWQFPNKNGVIAMLDDFTPVIEVADFASLPLPINAETGKIYLTLDDNKLFRWSGSPSNMYLEVSASSSVLNLQQVTDEGNVTTNSIEALSFVTTSGLSTDFVKGDGTLDNTTYASETYADGKVAQTITDGETTSAPSQDAVFDALALKQNSITLTTNNTSGASTLIGDTLNIPQYSETQTTIETKLGFGSVTALTIAFFNATKNLISATGSNLGAFFQSFNSKSLPIDDDTIIVNDSATSFEAKKTTLLQLYTYLKSKFDSVYGSAFSGTVGTFPVYNTSSSIGDSEFKRTNNQYVFDASTLYRFIADLSANPSEAGIGFFSNTNTLMWQLKTNPITNLTYLQIPGNFQISSRSGNATIVTGADLQSINFMNLKSRYVTIQSTNGDTTNLVSCEIGTVIGKNISNGGTLASIYTNNGLTYNNTLNVLGSLYIGTNTDTAVAVGNGSIRRNGFNLEYSDGTNWSRIERERNIITQSGTYTILTTDYIILCSSTSTFTLPNSTGLIGKTFIIYSNNFPLVVNANVADLIDGAVSASTTGYKKLEVRCLASGVWLTNMI